VSWDGNWDDNGNYMPVIALNSCLCLMNCRLVWFLESNNMLAEYQSGCRDNCSIGYSRSTSQI